MSEQLVCKLSDKSGYIHFPAALYAHPAFSSLSGEALLLYGICFSMQEFGETRDEEGNKCIRLTQKDVRDIFRCGAERAARIMHELDSRHGAGLLATKKFGNGQTVIYVRTSF